MFIFLQQSERCWEVPINEIFPCILEKAQGDYFGGILAVITTAILLSPIIFLIRLFINPEKIRKNKDLLEVYRKTLKQEFQLNYLSVRRILWNQKLRQEIINYSRIREQKTILLPLLNRKKLNSNELNNLNQFFRTLINGLKNISAFKDKAEELEQQLAFIENEQDKENIGEDNTLPFYPGNKTNNFDKRNKFITPELLVDGKQLVELQIGAVKNTLVPKNLKSIIKEKIKSDFEKNNLISSSKAIYSYKQAIRKQKDAGIFRESRIEENRIENMGQGVWKGIYKPEHLFLLKDYYPPLIINCVSTSVASITVFKRLQKVLLKQGTQLFLLYDCPTGRDQMNVIETTGDIYDFLISPNGPFNFTNHKNVDNYRIILSVYDADQFRLVKSGFKESKEGKILTPYASTGLEQARSEEKETGKNIEEFSIEDLEHIISELREIDQIILWNPPVLTALKKHKQLEKIHPPYQAGYSMMVHRKWLSQEKLKYLYAFESLFISTWNYCRKHQNECLDEIFKDDTYLRYFMLSANRQLVDKKDF